MDSTANTEGTQRLRAPLPAFPANSTTAATVTMAIPPCCSDAARYLAGHTQFSGRHRAFHLSARRGERRGRRRHGDGWIVREVPDAETVHRRCTIGRTCRSANSPCEPGPALASADNFGIVIRGREASLRRHSLGRTSGNWYFVVVARVAPARGQRLRPSGSVKTPHATTSAVVINFSVHESGSDQ